MKCHIRDTPLGSKVWSLPQFFKEAQGYLSLSYGKVFHQGLDDDLSWSSQREFPDGYPRGRANDTSWKTRKWFYEQWLDPLNANCSARSHGVKSCMTEEHSGKAPLHAYVDHRTASAAVNSIWRLGGSSVGAPPGTAGFTAHGQALAGGTWEVPPLPPPPVSRPAAAAAAAAGNDENEGVGGGGKIRELGEGNHHHHHHHHPSSSSSTEQEQQQDARLSAMNESDKHRSSTKNTDHRRRRRPWFMAVGFVRPHLPFVCPKRFWDVAADPYLSRDSSNTNDNENGGGGKPLWQQQQQRQEQPMPRGGGGEGGGGGEKGLGVGKHWARDFFPPEPVPGFGAMASKGMCAIQGTPDTG
jgi:hypothetical protein